MPGDISLDFGQALEFLLRQFLELLGKGPDVERFRDQIARQIRTSLVEAATVQCVGMHEPIQIGDIYQQVALCPRALSPSDLPSQLEPDDEESAAPAGSSGPPRCSDPLRVVRRTSNALVFSGPGQGKTTMIHWLFMQLRSDRTLLPLLLTLRRPSTIPFLQEFVRLACKPRPAKTVKGRRIILLIDGYDEIDYESRRAVSDALLEFASAELGYYFLTCRDYYDVYELHAKRYDVGPFRPEHALSYVHCFSKSYGVQIDAQALLQELADHRLGSFARHPLLLALTCILKSRAMPALPHDTIGLLRRAIDTLAFHWDEAKGVRRETTIPLDGDERIRCLMEVAGRMRLPRASNDNVMKYIDDHLKRLQRSTIDVRQLLREMAQFYGLLVPVDDYWEFTHRTVHDYLAARSDVEHGEFKPSRVREWNARAAYAACLLRDATESMVCALTATSDLYAVTECLYNNALFDCQHVAEAIEKHFAKFPHGAHLGRGAIGLEAHWDQDFLAMVSDDLLRSILVRSSGRTRTTVTDLLAAYGLGELKSRGMRLPRELYNQYLLRYGHAEQSFSVVRKGGGRLEFQLADLLPLGRIG